MQQLHVAGEDWTLIGPGDLERLPKSLLRRSVNVTAGRLVEDIVPFLKDRMMFGPLAYVTFAQGPDHGIVYWYGLENRNPADCAKELASELAKAAETPHPYVVQDPYRTVDVEF